MTSKTTYSITDFFSHLFWDVDRNKLDWEKNTSQIIKRVLEYGLLNDWKLVERYYGVEKIGKTCIGLQSLDDKALGFFATIADLPGVKLFCIIGSSMFFYSMFVV